ncbi:hypothetical protein GE09DRAFT_5502 [Coniochaeta sp. 2T2.1]|nr:hypothetical protein GE09DRAFT_5502 [Coniochaeta sp. 2T2.1]
MKLTARRHIEASAATLDQLELLKFGCISRRGSPRPEEWFSTRSRRRSGFVLQKEGDQSLPVSCAASQSCPTSRPLLMSVPPAPTSSNLQLHRSLICLSAPLLNLRRLSWRQCHPDSLTCASMGSHSLPYLELRSHRTRGESRFPKRLLIIFFCRCFPLCDALAHFFYGITTSSQ